MHLNEFKLNYSLTNYLTIVHCHKIVKPEHHDLQLHHCHVLKTQVINAENLCKKNV